jgi:glycosyltransferase involved in cell wall biosynthesis
MKQRLRFVRERAEREAEQRAVDSLFEKEKLRVATGASNVASPVEALIDRQDLAAFFGVEPRLVSWPAVAPDAIADLASAARFCIDLLRSDAGLRARFPDALSSGGQGAFACWIQSAGGDLTGLPTQARQQISDLLDADFAQRARQAFLIDDEVRTALPHGLTPAAQLSLFEWFVRRGRRATNLAPEEVWWLFLQAAENPVQELQQAFLFTPEWQRLFPDGLTAFGWERFVAWFAKNYGVADWVSAANWPPGNDAATDLRVAYRARRSWQVMWPHALTDSVHARQMLAWLCSGESDVSDMARRWCRSLDLERVSSELTKTGANILGHFCYPSGLRASVEALAEGLVSNGVPVSLRDVRTDAKDEPHHARFHGLEVYDVTIIHAQPEPYFKKVYERVGLAPRLPRPYRIAYWYWEFDLIPEGWRDFVGEVDEIWTATEFIARGLRRSLQLPVRRLPPGVSLAPYTRRSLAHFGLDPGRFTFLFTFNMMSVMERKNPLGLIEAFRAAFRPDEPVSLVLKSSFGDRHPAEMQAMHDAAGDASIHIIDAVYSSDEVLSLMDASDAYVSLHRSEGLGLTMAEAMLMGKPVIATRYSGNVDFMDDSNSLLVDYELISLGRDIPPYGAELEWAEPSISHAAQLMRRLYDDPDGARALGQAAMQSATAKLSVEAAGRASAQRLEEIRRGGPAAP